MIPKEIEKLGDIYLLCSVFPDFESLLECRLLTFNAITGYREDIYREMPQMANQWVNDYGGLNKRVACIIQGRAIDSVEYDGIYA